MARVPFSVFYETATGKAVSFGSVVDQTDQELAARGITRQEIPAQHMDPTGKKQLPDRRWNAATKGFDIIVLPRRISMPEFWDRFTTAEQEEIEDRARNGSPAAQKRLGAFLRRLSIQKVVDLNDPRLITAVNDLETTTLIGANRAKELLA